MSSQTDSGISSAPNKFARPAGIEVQPGKVTIHGYQEFQVTDRKIKPLSIDAPLQRKEELAGAFFNPEFLTGRTVLDIGANGGFFSMWARLNGAKEIVSLDMDETYLGMIGQAQTALGWSNIRPVNCKVQDWSEPADLVLAFAMVHWLYSCTANFGSLDAVVGKLAGLSKAVLLMEWVSPDDNAIKEFKHTEWNPQVDKAGYNVDAFEAAMRKHFCRVEILGATSPTRVLYAGFHQTNEVTLHPALPLLAAADKVISSRWLTEHEDTKYYSRIYAGPEPDQITKQATGDMALHEAGILRKLQGPHFPRVISSEQRDGYSVLVMERIDGSGLDTARGDISADPKRLAKFFGECLGILRKLQEADVKHRDIRIGNFLVRDGSPVLIDFGWAEAGNEKYVSPSGLGGLERIKSGPPCDAYSLGKVFEQLVPKGSKLFLPLLEKMLDPATIRDVSVPSLKKILQGLALPDAWDVPLVFPIPSHEEVKSPATVQEGIWGQARKIFGSTKR